jgi:hypothetical protein
LTLKPDKTRQFWKRRSIAHMRDMNAVHAVQSTFERASPAWLYRFDWLNYERVPAQVFTVRRPLAKGILGKALLKQASFERRAADIKAAWVAQCRDLPQAMGAAMANNPVPVALWCHMEFGSYWRPNNPARVALTPQAEPDLTE